MWKSFVAGGVAGVGAVLSGHPLDTVKVRLQTQPVDSAGIGRNFTGMVDCFKKTIRKEGLAGLYRGMSTPLIAYTPIWALCFLGFESGVRLQGKQKSEMNYAEIALAGSVAGVGTSAIMGPAERVKSLLQVQRGTTGQNMYSGPVDVARKVGFRGLFQGTLATLYRDVPGTGVYFAINAFFKDRTRSSTGGNSSASLVFAGGMAGVLAWAMQLPIDVVKSRVQIAPMNSPKARFGYAFRLLIREEGVLGLYRGSAPVMARAFPCNGIAFLLFDTTMRSLDRISPG